METITNGSDYIVRATAANADIRALACTTRGLVETARRAHNTSPVITAALGRMLTAGAMMGIMLKGEKDLLTLQIKGDGPVKGLIVTADAEANVKGYPTVPDVIVPATPQGKLNVAGAIGNGFLRIIKDMGLKEPYVGQTALQTSEIAEDLTYYFATSEQVPSCVGLGVLMQKDNTVKQAGGFIIQLMPFAGEDTIKKLEKNLEGLSSVTTMLEGGNTPEQILEIVLDGLEVEIAGTIPTQFTCNCKKEKIEQVLISIGREELGKMIEEGKEVEVNCSFCNKNYSFEVNELQELYKNANDKIQVEK